MSPADDMLAAQTQRLRSIDPLLPAAVAPPPAEVLAAGHVTGALLRSDHPAGSPARMWSASHVSELVPVLGDAGLAGMDTLLGAWRDRLPDLGMPARDSACVVCWPSRDVEIARALLDHGFVPLSVIAVNIPLDAARGVTSQRHDGVRPADPGDLEACLRLALAEQAYSAMVGGTVLRDDTEEVKRGLIAARLQRGEPTWVADQDGVTVGLAECGYSDAVPGNWVASRLPAGRWGYINCTSVLPGARDHGVGGRLVGRVHAAFAAAGVLGSYLYYNPPNPLSSVFWPRQGYRPLWTIWEARPATSLR